MATERRDQATKPRRFGTSPRGARGLTLLELLVTLAIGVTVLTLGVSAFTTIIAENRMATAVNTLVSHLQLARSEAIKRGQDVTICVSTNKADTDACEGDASGWAIRYATVADQSGTPEVLRIQDGDFGSVVTISAQTDAITYSSDGTTNTAAASDEFKFQDGGGHSNCRMLKVSAVGYVSTTKQNSVVCPAYDD